MNLVFLSGAISGVTWKEATEWRAQFKETIEDLTSRWKCFDPTLHFNDDPYCNIMYGDRLEYAAMNMDLHKLRNADVVIMDLNHPNSIGTAVELGVAIENRIPIIAFCDQDKRSNIHPWQEIAPLMICDCIEDAMTVFIDQFINLD